MYENLHSHWDPALLRPSRSTAPRTKSRDFSRALVTDELTDTLNYAEVCKIISDEMAIPSRLLEHVAGRIINSLRSHYPQITGGRLIVTKEKPPIPGDIRDVSVIVEW